MMTPPVRRLPDGSALLYPALRWFRNNRVKEKALFPMQNKKHDIRKKHLVSFYLIKLIVYRKRAVAAAIPAPAWWKGQSAGEG